MVSFQKDTRTVSPWEKKMFSTAVKIRIITNGFMPRRMALGGIFEMAMTVQRQMSITA